MIDGVKVIDLKQIKDDRGWLMEIFRVSTTGLNPKQVYLSVVKEGIVKDKDKFHCHEKQWDMFCCVKGKVKLVLIDKREDSPTKGNFMEFVVGDDNFKLIVYPPGILHAFKGLKGDSYIVNCVTEEYNKENPDELRVENKFYDWDKEEIIK
ncbi:MAG: dTDP-4-dehydrorhamnose 3,5-epimerase [Thermoprotei archaeon]|nr:MAG: dTDP-4-dehydrorhamnose 3,5-epimerase [Thermoprotei archaeon]